MVWPFRAIHDEHDNGSGTSSATSSPDRHTDASDAQDRQRRIAQAAYYRAERRGFAPGYEEEDWLEAEKEISGASESDADEEREQH
jgi:hypothetical protein